MNEFVRKHEDRIHGVLSCFDRMLFRGYLPIMSGWSMAQLLKAHEIDCSSVKPFLLSNAERIKAHAVAMAHKHGRPFEYLGTKLRKEDAARKFAERDGITDGLVCVFSTLEPCRTFSLRFTPGQPYVQSAKRKCQSMGSVGDAYDNAMAESFFASLACELIDRRSWKTLTEARLATFTWVESWYNPRRLHSSIGYFSRIDRERRHQDQPCPTRAAEPGLPTGCFAPVDSTLYALDGAASCPQASPVDNPAPERAETPMHES